MKEENLAGYIDQILCNIIQIFAFCALIFPYVFAKKFVNYLILETKKW